MRVEEVVLRAGTAKGTFFAHFKDKDALMDRIIGARIDTLLDELEARPAPKSVPEIVSALLPLCRFMTCERYVFDVILRHSGAAGIEEIGPIAMTFDRQAKVLETWLENGAYRPDISNALRAEGVHAFLMQAISVNFCALHNATSIEERLAPYLDAWLLPKAGVA